jgi:hypothetical protein
MNNILHNISVIILCVGIIMMTIYITKSNSYKNIPIQQNDPQTDEPMNPDVYTQKPATIFKDMFLENSSWLSKYKSIDNSAQPNLYI